MIELRDHVERDRLPQLMELFSGAWWARSRTAADVATVLERSDLVFALLDRDADRLVGFARVLTDGVYLAMVLDVIVAEDARRRGLGAMLMEAVMAHPAVAPARSVELVCQPRSWCGFTAAGASPTKLDSLRYYAKVRTLHWSLDIH